MNIEENRLKTFAQWPETAGVNPLRMARGGFFYIGHGTVECFICETRISDWEYGDQVMVRHRQANPHCPFVQDPSSTCNVPIIENPSNFLTQPTSSTSSTQTNEMNNRSNSGQPVILPSSNPRVEYATYEQRLSSFQNWPTFAAISPESLARAGFYYLQQEDMVECIYCRRILNKWEPNDDPETKHRTLFPNCEFFAPQESNLALPTVEKEDFTNVKLLSGTSSDLDKLGIQKHTAPKQPKYGTYEGRIRTFQGWPKNLRQRPDILAIAGFYYVGSGDQVRCFHCDGGLHNWETDDDPWTEHARWFPKCGFVSIVRGQDFIKHCIDNRPPLDPSIFHDVPEDGEEGDVPPTPPSPEAINANSITRQQRLVTNSEVEELLLLPPAITALNIGLNVGRVKAALRQRMENFGVPYSDLDQLIEHVRHVHLDEESNGLENSTEASISELANLMSKVKIVPSSSSSTEPQSTNIDARQEAIANGDNQAEPGNSNKDRLENKTENEPHFPVSLEEEIRRLKEARLCKICMDREVSVVFLPCGHLATCVHCAPSLTDCPMCRQEIRATVRTFLA